MSDNVKRLSLSKNWCLDEYMFQRIAMFIFSIDI